jgi:hypothetical protein
MSYFKVKCPGKRSHKRRVGQSLTEELNCGMLLGFIENSDETNTSNVYYCRNCKRLVKAQVKKGEEIISLNLLPNGTKLDEVDRSFTTDDY